MARQAGQPAVVHKDESQLRQKRMIAEHFSRLARTPETGEKNVYTFVPGNLTELLRAFDLLPESAVAQRIVAVRASAELYRKGL